MFFLKGELLLLKKASMIDYVRLGSAGSASAQTQIQAPRGGGGASGSGGGCGGGGQQQHYGHHHTPAQGEAAKGEAAL